MLLCMKERISRLSTIKEKARNKRDKAALVENPNTWIFITSYRSTATMKTTTVRDRQLTIPTDLLGYPGLWENRKAKI